MACAHEWTVMGRIRDCALCGLRQYMGRRLVGGELSWFGDGTVRSPDSPRPRRPGRPRTISATRERALALVAGGADTSVVLAPLLGKSVGLASAILSSMEAAGLVERTGTKIRSQRGGRCQVVFRVRAGRDAGA